MTIDRNGDRFRVEIDCGGLQPGRRVWSDEFSVGVMREGTVSLAGEVFAANLPEPKAFTLTVAVSLTRTTLSADELDALPAPGDESD